MEATFLQDGNSINYTPSGNVAAGEVVVLGTTCFVATQAIAANKLGAIATRGVFRCAKTKPLAISAGDACYWNAAGNLITKTSSDVYFGIAVADAAETADTVDVDLRSLQAVVAGQLGLADLSDIDAATATAGNLLIGDGNSFEPAKLDATSLKVLTSAAAVPFVMRAVCTAVGAKDEVVAVAPVKCRIVQAHFYARDTNAANVKLHQGTAGADDITDAIAKGTADDVRVQWAKIIEEKAEVAASTVIKANFSAAGSIDVVIEAIPIT